MPGLSNVRSDQTSTVDVGERVGELWRVSERSQRLMIYLGQSDPPAKSDHEQNMKLQIGTVFGDAFLFKALLRTQIKKRTLSKSQKVS